MLFAIYTMACNFLLGWVGFISFGQPAYLAVGSYASAIYLFYFGTNPWIVIAWGLVAGVGGTALVGPQFVKMRSDYFALVNLAFCVIMYYLIEKILKNVTQGDNGLFYIDKIDNTALLNPGNPKGLYIMIYREVPKPWTCSCRLCADAGGAFDQAHRALWQQAFEALIWGWG